jgi:hypothetical protein
MVSQPRGEAQNKECNMCGASRPRPSLLGQLVLHCYTPYAHMRRDSELSRCDSELESEVEPAPASARAVLSSHESHTVASDSLPCPRSAWNNHCCCVKTVCGIQSRYRVEKEPLHTMRSMKERKKNAPTKGIEPLTNRLRAERSTS